jgi:hypothetical protein
MNGETMKIHRRGDVNMFRHSHLRVISISIRKEISDSRKRKKIFELVERKGMSREKKKGVC